MNLLLTGPPGAGKTTVIERVVALLPADSASGFFTRELREGGMRHGFAIETLDGETAVLASLRFSTGPRVGRYRVDVGALDRVAIPTIAARTGVELIVVDEIGKMECLSPRFCDAVRKALHGPTPMLGTIARTGGGFMAEVRRRRDVTLIELSSANRDAMPERLIALLRAALTRPT